MSNLKPGSLRPAPSTLDRPPAIATQRLTKQFDRKTVVNEVELTINAGEVYGLIGPNGAGKTTLIKLLATAETASYGDIYVNGTRLDPNQPNPEIKQRIGYLPDDYPLYNDLSVWDYLDYFARLYQLRSPRRNQRLHEVLELVDLGSKRNSQIATLSRGMKQRLGLARTILHQPLILLLDEPVSGLDPLARVQFRDIVRSLQEAGMTVLISSHVLSDLAELCTAVGIMELGCLVESASMKDLYQRLSRQHLDIQVLDEALNVDAFKAELRNCPDVGEIENRGNGLFTVKFNGDPAAASALLRQLVVDSGLTISQFNCRQEDLESIFLTQLDHKQVS
jgi:ABC-2 type transport system ATP-binding protein